MPDYRKMVEELFLAPARAYMAQSPKAPQGLLGDIHRAIDPVNMFGGYGGLLAMGLPMGSAPKMGMNLPKRAYHGTAAEIDKFTPPSGEYMPDRALGPHFAADPEVANAFASGLHRNTQGYLEGNIYPGGKVYPVDVDTANFLKVDQPAYSWRKPDMKPWEGILTDQTAIQNLVGVHGFKARPDLLAKYLEEARRLPPADAKRVATDLAAGKKVKVDGREETLDSFVSNYGGTPYNQADRDALVTAARESLIKQGYGGLTYTNTSPMETANIKDATTFLPFKKGTVKSALTGSTMFGGLLALNPRER